MRIAMSPRVIRMRHWTTGRPALELRSLPKGVLESASTIIIVRLDRLGDAVLFSSFLREVRMAAAKASIHLVCSSVGFPAYEHCPYVNRVHVFDYGQPVYTALSLYTADEHRRLYNAAKTFAHTYLVPLHADLLVAPRFEVDAYGGTYLGVFSGARFSVSYSEKSTDIRQHVNRGHDQLWSVVIPGFGVEHEVVRNAAFLERIGVTTHRPVLEFWPTAEEQEAAERLLAQLDFKRRPVALSPGASELRKQWPSDRFALVARALGEAGENVVLIGSEADTALCSSIASQLQSPRVKDTSGKLSVGSLFCLLQKCSGYLGNDSGPAHLAAAAGIPVVVVSCHPSDGKDDYHQSPHRFGPWGVPHRVLQPHLAISPCIGLCSARRSHCIERISVNEVAQSALDLFIDRKGLQETVQSRGFPSHLCARPQESA